MQPTLDDYQYLLHNGTLADTCIRCEQLEWMEAVVMASPVVLSRGVNKSDLEVLAGNAAEWSDLPVIVRVAPYI
jgi:hypothetical protein